MKARLDPITGTLIFLILAFGGYKAAEHGVGDPTPDLTTGEGCAFYGVAEEGNTGPIEVLSAEKVGLAEIQAICPYPNRTTHGCLVLESEDQGRVYYTDSYSRWHELCHAALGEKETRGQVF